MNRRSVVFAGVASVTAPFTVAAQTPSAEQANIDVVRRFYKEFVNGMNLDAAADVIHPDYQSATPGNAPGIDALVARNREVFASMQAQFTEFEYTEDQTMAAGDDVAYRGRFTATSTDGKLVGVDDVAWFRLKDGLIITYWGGTDGGEISNQLYGF